MVLTFDGQDLKRTITSNTWHCKFAISVYCDSRDDVHFTLGCLSSGSFRLALHERH